MNNNQYYTKEQLQTIAETNNIPGHLLADFIDRVAEEISEMSSEGELEPEEIKTLSIKFAVEDILMIETLLQNGHSRAWADLYTDSYEEHQHAFNDAYLAMKKANPEQALEELKIFCRSAGYDEYAQKHFIYLMQEAKGAAQPTPQEQAIIYSSIFKEQLIHGRSDIFAHQYAHLKAEGQYVEEYCYRFAHSYDDALQKGKSGEYAYLFADKMGDYYADYYGRHIKDAENHQFKERQILGYMKGWEYAKAHQIKNPDTFISCYESTYINERYPDLQINSFHSEDEFDQHVLKIVLSKLKMV